jgi:hypothetical protein
MLVENTKHPFANRDLAIAVPATIAEAEEGAEKVFYSIMLTDLSRRCSNIRANSNDTHARSPLLAEPS